MHTATVTWWVSSGKKRTRQVGITKRRKAHERVGDLKQRRQSDVWKESGGILMGVTVNCEELERF